MATSQSHEKLDRSNKYCSLGAVQNKSSNDEIHHADLSNLGNRPSGTVHDRPSVLTSIAMCKRKSLFFFGAIAVSAAAIIIFLCGKADQIMPTSLLVAEKGIPTFLAERLRMDKADMRVLQVLLLPQDPQLVTNWNSITNAILVWADSEPARRNARYFYDDMKNKTNFDGSGWYSTRSLFHGEEVTTVKTDATGNASDLKSFRIDAFSMQLMGFVPAKPGVSRHE